MEKIEINKKTVTHELVLFVKVWLDESDKYNQEKEQFDIFDYRYRNLENDSSRYRSMAQALYLSGKHLGISFPDEIENIFKVDE